MSFLVTPYLIMTCYESKCVRPIASKSVINICILLSPLSYCYYHIHNPRLDCCGDTFVSLRSLYHMLIRDASNSKLQLSCCSILHLYCKRSRIDLSNCQLYRQSVSSNCLTIASKTSICSTNVILACSEAHNIIKLESN